MAAASRLSSIGSALAAAAAFAWAGAATAQQLLLHFPLDGTPTVAGNAAGDSRLYLFDGGPAPATVPGKVGNALHFSGKAAIAMPFKLDATTYPQVTVTAWVKLDPDSTGDRTVFSAGNGNVPKLMVNVDRNNFTAARGSLRAATPMPRGEWVFVAGTIDVAAARLENVQGEAFLAREGINTGNLYPPSSYRNPDDPSLPAMPYVFVGSHGFGQWRATGMAIDDVRVYAGVLTQEQVAAVRDAGGAIGDPAAPSLATLASSQIPQPAAGTGNLFQNETPEVVLADRPPGPLDLTGGGSDVPLLEAPPAANPDGTLDPQLAAPQGLPAQQLEEAVAVARGASPLAQSRFGETEVYRKDADGPIRRISIVLPGQTVAQEVTYQEVDGLAIAEGDMILGLVDDLQRWQDAVTPEVPGAPGVRRQGLNAVANTDYLWPDGIIPFRISPDLPAESQQVARDAVLRLNAATLNPAGPSSLLLVEHDGEEAYVEFVQGSDAGACSSAVGRQGKRQLIHFGANGCSITSVIHEILHAAGVWHEQSRPDRGDYIDIVEENIQTEPQDRRPNFEKKSTSAAVALDDYNYRSIMHYSVWAFGKSCTPSPPAGATTDPDCSCSTAADGTESCVARTIRPLDSSVTISRDASLGSDIAGIRQLYPGARGPRLATGWGAGCHATAIAAGDIDGDGRAEVIAGGSACTPGRLFVHDDSARAFQLLTDGGNDWGADVEITDVAVGDVDGDGRMEIGVARRAGSFNRYYVYRYSDRKLTQVFAGGDDWGAENYATAIAFGDVDGDGRDEIAVGRRAATSGRYYLFDDAAAATPFRRLAIGGSQWGSGDHTTALAFGDVDGDGRSELGITRRAGSNQRFEIVTWTGSRLDQVHAGGHDWDGTHYGSAIAFGNVDDDPADEVVVGRRAASGSRFHVIDDQRNGFRLLETGGDLWGSGYYVVAVEMADVDGDGRDEILVARNAGEHKRYFAFNDRLRGFAPILVSGGTKLPPGVGATDIAAGDTNGDGRADLAVAYAEKAEGGARYEIIYMNAAGN